MWRVSSCERHAILFSDQESRPFPRTGSATQRRRTTSRSCHAPRGLRPAPPAGLGARDDDDVVDDEGDFATVDMALPLHQRVAILRAEAPEVMTR